MSWEAALLEGAKVVAMEAAKEAAKEVADKAVDVAKEGLKEAVYDLPERFGEIEPTPEYLPETMEDIFYPNAQFEVDGISYETDDNGCIFKMNGEVRPDSEYVLNGVEYKSDANGQVTRLDRAESDAEQGSQGELKAEKPELSPEEISQKQAQIIETVENGEEPLDSNLKKGNYGEMKVDQDLERRGYERISTDAVTDLEDPTHRGIDGVYYNPDGEPPYVIVDAKYDTAELKETADGLQMSESWIDARLDDAVGKDIADEIRMAQLNDDVGCYVGRVAKGGDLAAEVIYDRVDAAGNIVEKDVKINGT